MHSGNFPKNENDKDSIELKYILNHKISSFMSNTKHNIIYLSKLSFLALSYEELLLKEEFGLSKKALKAFLKPFLL